MDTFELEHVTRLYVAGGAYLEIGEWAEAPGVLEVRVNGPQSVDHFGPISLTLSPRQAEMLVQALQAQIGFITTKKAL